MKYFIESNRVEPNEHRTEQGLCSIRLDSFESNRTRTEILRTEQGPCSTRFLEQKSCVRLDRTESNRVEPNCVRFDEPSLCCFSFACGEG